MPQISVGHSSSYGCVSCFWSTIDKSGYGFAILIIWEPLAPQGSAQ